MRLFLKNIKSQQSGIALILSVIILIAIFGLVIVVADVAFDIRASNKSIGSSEIALFAAEAAAELTIYDVEFNGVGFGDPETTGTIDYPATGNNAEWSRDIELSLSTPGLCTLLLPDGNESNVTPSPVCTDALGAVNTGNPLMVILEDNRYFQLDLDLKGADAFYPNHIKVSSVEYPPGNTPLSGSSLIISGDGEQIIIPSPFINEKIPPGTGSLVDLNYKIRIKNKSGFTQKYEITTDNINDELPLGLEIRVRGKYLDTERNITLIRPAWLIY